MILLILCGVILGTYVFMALGFKIITQNQRNDARRYLDTLATNWTRIETQAVINGDDCYMCWQAQALVNLAYIIEGWDYAQDIASRIGMITETTCKEKRK